jgi:hypothetical protein
MIAAYIFTELQHMALHSVRVSETASTWSEYIHDDCPWKYSA